MNYLLIVGSLQYITNDTCRNHNIGLYIHIIFPVKLPGGEI